MATLVFLYNMSSSPSLSWQFLVLSTPRTCRRIPSLGLHSLSSLSWLMAILIPRKNDATNFIHIIFPDFSPLKLRHFGNWHYLKIPLRWDFSSWFLKNVYHRLLKSCTCYLLLNRVFTDQFARVLLMFGSNYFGNVLLFFIYPQFLDHFLQISKLFASSVESIYWGIFIIHTCRIQIQLGNQILNGMEYHSHQNQICNTKKN